MKSCQCEVAAPGEGNTKTAESCQDHVAEVLATGKTFVSISPEAVDRMYSLGFTKYLFPRDLEEKQKYRFCRLMDCHHELWSSRGLGIFSGSFFFTSGGHMRFIQCNESLSQKEKGVRLNPPPPPTHTHTHSTT